ncbi:MAG: RNA polymerase-binding protein DksA [Sulfurovaceae bacterium]|nr:RNA polymerase-binding protein DksA [Sulfurovaceae bacterium]
MTKALNPKYYNNNTTTLTKNELLFFKTELEAKKVKIQRNLNITSSELNINSTSDLRDEGDYASQALETSTNNAILHEQSKTLNQINRSLNQIRVGSYGICNLCEESINIERLKVKIFAEYCISCRELMEKKR